MDEKIEFQIEKFQLYKWHGKKKIYETTKTVTLHSIDSLNDFLSLFKILSLSKKHGVDKMNFNEEFGMFWFKTKNPNSTYLFNGLKEVKRNG